MFLLLSLFLLCACAIAQTVTPFALDGGLDGASADSTDYNSGGSISVNGWTITVPKNLQVQFPAAFVPWKDFAASSAFGGHEVSVTGNVVDGKPIAGLIQVSQFLLEGGTGVVSAVNTDGSMTIQGGPTIRINDPNGVYGKAYTGLSKFYTADDENPSITAFSGFPMCIPRGADDAACPSSNRPAGQRTFPAPDPLSMAPFIVGDYLEYSGVKVGGEIICYAIVAPNVQISTSGAPTYIRVEDSIIGVFGADPNAEFGDTRFIGYSSDASAAISVYAIEVDPCTGVETERSVGAAAYKAGDARNKWTWRADSTTATKYTREYRVRASTGDKLTKNKITAGQYVQPVTEWIFPEANVPGIIPPVNDFSNFNFLAKGLGRDDDGNLWGPLSPWPGASAPAATSCGPAPAPTSSGSSSPTSSGAPLTATPTATAGPDATIRPGIVVVLNGTVSNSGDFPSNDLNYTWTQVSGPSITLSGTNALKPSFTAAAVTTSTKYILNLKVVSTAAGTSSSTNITLTSDPSVKDIVTIDSYTWTTTQSGTISVTAHSNVVDGSVKTMTLYLQNTLPNPLTTGALTMTSLGGGKFSYSARSTKKPATGITVLSGTGGGGSASLGTVTARKRRRGSGFGEVLSA